MKLSKTETTHPTPERQDLVEQIEETGSAAAELVGTVFTVGRLWASHGLSIADRTLQAASDSLDTTAQMLGDLARRFGEERTER